MASRREVMDYAERHGAKAAGARYGVPSGTIRSWRSRARKRAARDGTAPPTPAERWLAEARQLAERYAKRLCLQCGGSGEVNISAVTRGNLTVRPARRIECPSCGGRIRHLEVVEHGRDSWLEGQRVAGDAGFDWSGDEWAQIRSGQPNPNGRRITGRPDA
jgi:transposase-like protein